MYFYDNYKEVKSIDDLNVGDLIKLSIDNTRLPSSFNQKKINSEWIIISKIENKQIIIRHRYGKQIIKISNLKLKNGIIKFDVDKKTTLIFKVLYKKKHSILKYIKSKLNNLIKWVF